MITFSIIVPVYKVEQYLDRCVMSLVKQDYDKNKIEIILVDDGSQDKCSKMCDDYAKQYSNIKVFHKDNGGLSDARNFGLSYALNDYIMFVDSDDYIETNACKVFSQKIEHYSEIIDICTGGVMEHIDDCQRIRNIESILNGIVSGKTHLKDRLEKKQFIAVAWANIYRREFLINNKLIFYKGRLHEDEEFTPRAFLLAKRLVASDYVFYHYIIRGNSITTKKDKTKNALDIQRTVNDLYQIYSKIEDNYFKKLLLSHNSKICYRAIVEGKLYLKHNRKMIDYKAIKNNSVCLMEKIKYLLLCINPTLLHILSKISGALKNGKKQS